MAVIKIIFITFSLLIFANQSSSSVIQERHYAKILKTENSIDLKLLFNQLFALEIKKENLPDKYIDNYTFYTPLDFNDAIDKVTSVSTTREAYEMRYKVFGDKSNRDLITKGDLLSTLSPQFDKETKAYRYLKTILDNKDRKINLNEHFLDTPEGKNMVNAINCDEFDGIAFILVPGYAAHTIKDYIFEELVFDFNEYYGRPKTRPIISSDGLDIKFETHTKFYSTNNGKEKIFDVLHPMGDEMGNTTGYNAETTDLLYNWIKTLPPEYDNKGLIFLGYSKGAPIVLDLPVRHPDVRNRILGFVTYGGVLQGTNVARTVLENAKDILKSKNVDDLVDKLVKKDPQGLISEIVPVFGYLNMMLFKFPVITDVLKLFGYEVEDLKNKSKEFFQRREVKEILHGAIDLSPKERVEWNIKYFNNRYFKNNFLFNLSSLTDISTFTRPYGIDDGIKSPSLLTPQFDEDGNLNWKMFSLDALFLYITSINGFKTAPGGLFDTQVELANSKAFSLDRRCLRESLTRDELSDLWNKPEIRNNVSVSTFEEFANTPRNKLLYPKNINGISAVNLGEIRCHHWCTFRQALKPPEQVSHEFAQWTFPRKAYMRALLQTMALYILVKDDNE